MGAAWSLRWPAPGFEVLQVPAWRTHRERHRRGPGKTDPGDALSIAHVVLTKRDELGPAEEPELVRVLGMLELQRRRFVRDRTQAIQRLRSTGPSTTPSPRPASSAATPARAAPAQAHPPRRQPANAPPRAASASSPATSTTSTTASPPSTQRSPSCSPSTTTPLDDLLGAGTNLAATIIAQAGDVRRFRDAGAFARFCGTAPIPCGSGQTTGRHRLHRGGNRQLNAALYRIAIVQQRHHPAAKSYLARKIAEGKTAREARRALKRHLANVVYRRLYAWADTCPGMQLLT